jgi:16S rRNA (cytidine1402-2'-O)-methyltransferase
MPGTLYLVATPIGNLADITHRAIDVLTRVALIACEDTRHTRKLLQHYGIATKTVSYHEHNEQQRARELIEVLKRGADVAIRFSGWSRRRLRMTCVSFRCLVQAR